jgi:hypothetical protein
MIGGAIYEYHFEVEKIDLMNTVLPENHFIRRSYLTKTMLPVKIKRVSFPKWGNIAERINIKDSPYIGLIGLLYVSHENNPYSLSLQEEGKDTPTGFVIINDHIIRFPDPEMKYSTLSILV